MVPPMNCMRVPAVESSYLMNYILEWQATTNRMSDHLKLQQQSQHTALCKWLALRVGVGRPSVPVSSQTTISLTICSWPIFIFGSFYYMRKTVSVQPRIAQSPARPLLRERYSQKLQEQCAPVSLSSYHRTRNTFTYNFESNFEHKQEAPSAPSKLVLKQQAIKNIGNLIIQQLNARRNTLQKVGLNQVRREEIFMEEVLHLVAMGYNGLKKKESERSNKLGPADEKSQGRYVLYKQREQDKNNLMVPPIEVNPEERIPVKQSESSQTNEEPVRIRCRKWSFNPTLNMELINGSD